MTDDEKRIFSAQLGSKDLKHISDMGKETQAENLRAVIDRSREYTALRSQKITEITADLETWKITRTDLGLNSTGTEDPGTLALLRNYKHILKRKGKAALVDAIKADIERHGLEANKEVQNPETENTDTATNPPTGEAP